MTIELVTGTPGAGKTTLAVATRLLVEEGRQIEVPTDECLLQNIPVGSVVTRRVVQGGIRGLLVPHDRIPHTLTGEPMGEDEIEFWNRAHAVTVEASHGDEESGWAVSQAKVKGEPVFKRLPSQPAWTADEFEAARLANPEAPAVWFRPSLFNWWLWVKPGDLVCIDEIQYIMPRGTLGRKPPIFVALMEIHRHYGVDFLVITQNPELLDPTVRKLVGLHRHVRSVMGMPLCAVYVWDHASNVERYSMATKTKFLRRAKHYRLFKSATLHVKPPNTGRGLLFIVPVLAIVACTAFVLAKNRLGGHKVESVPVAAAQAGTLPSSQQGRAVPAVAVTGGRPAGFVDVPDLAGCVGVGEDCTCIVRGTGRHLKLSGSMCVTTTTSFDGLIEWQARAAPLQKNYGAGAAAQGAVPTAEPASAPPARPLFGGPKAG